MAGDSGSIKDPLHQARMSPTLDLRALRSDRQDQRTRVVETLEFVPRPGSANVLSRTTTHLCGVASGRSSVGRAQPCQG